jgi:hypothetical protein
MMKFRLKLIWGILSFLFFFGCDDSSNGNGGGFTTVQSPIFTARPNSFNFPSVEIGQPSEFQTVEISNEGEAVLRLVDFNLQFNNNASYILKLNDDIVFDSQGNTLPEAIDIEPDQSLRLSLQYTGDSEGVGSFITFQTNDTDQRSVSLPIMGSTSAAELNVSPAALDFGRVEANSEEMLPLTITNVGTTTAYLSQLSISGSSDFRIELNGADPVADPSLLNDPDGDGEPGLSSTKNVVFNVYYNTPTEGPDSGTLSIITNDGATQNVDLVANGESPCINLFFPDSASSGSDRLEFGPSLIDYENIQNVIVESCGGQILEIRDIRIEGTNFSLGAGVPPSFPQSLPARNENNIPSQSFEVIFNPTAEEVYEGLLIIESNDPSKEVIEIPILGLGSVNACPTAAVAQTDFEVLPLEMITLDGSTSVDADGPNGTPVEYEWVVTQRPDGSTAQPVESFSNPLRPADGGPMDNLATPTAQFFVDLAGEYVIELRVRDNLGFEAPSDTCPQAEATVYINSLPDEDIHVELTWTTPGDVDSNGNLSETDDNGTDVDLHFLHPNAPSWEHFTYDCYYANKFPDWGPSGPVGNPSLDIDDVNGAGPENINLDDPEDTPSLPYKIGVVYYSSGAAFGFGDDFGPSDATIRVYLFGQLEGEWTRRLNATGNFWEVAGIIWRSNEKRVQEINRYYDLVP